MALRRVACIRRSQRVQCAAFCCGGRRFCGEGGALSGGNRLAASDGVLRQNYEKGHGGGERRSSTERLSLPRCAPVRIVMEIGRRIVRAGHLYQYGRGALHCRRFRRLKEVRMSIRARMMELDELPEKLVVIGGGYIGLGCILLACKFRF